MSYDTGVSEGEPNEYTKLAAQLQQIEEGTWCREGRHSCPEAGTESPESQAGGQVMNMLNGDIQNCITALECHIIDHEEDLIKRNAGDEEWSRVEPFRETLNNLRMLQAIYGK